MTETISKNKAIACIGAGYWGKNLVRNFSSLGALQIICDRDQATVDAFRERYPSVACTTDLNAVLQAAHIQGVVIATPAETHYGLVEQALRRGKDVFVEKPLALTVAEGERLVTLARERERILMVGHILEYHPGVLALKDLVKRGELGKINYVYSNRLNLGKFRQEENILWSFAPHDISVILLLLGELPVEVSATGGNYLQEHIADVTVTTMRFGSGARAHIFVSWLHPFKEQKLVVVGDKKMAVFNDMEPRDKLLMYEHRIDWIDRIPVPRREDAKAVSFGDEEPLRAECLQFLESIETRQPPRTDGEEGVRVLRILEACQQSLRDNGRPRPLVQQVRDYFVHETSLVDDGCSIGSGTQIWHFSHIMEGSSVGNDCSFGQNVFIGKGVTVGDNVKIQNNVSVFAGVTLEDGVFCGPSCVFTNVVNPRSLVPRKKEFRQTLVKKGATIGANATIICGHTLGRFSFIGAGSVVTEDVPDYALVYGNPGKVRGWICECGVRLPLWADGASTSKTCRCEACGRVYQKAGARVVQQGQP